MTKVYVVEQGQYSAREVVGVYSSLESAKASCRGHKDEVPTWEHCGSYLIGELTELNWDYYWCITEWNVEP